ncbi:hypothetical protein Pmani_038451 [Petrolisthes manimaculis]|uniref:Gustatory receptor n=1 Tax=Petrolisthes manimaculis TaxID=1843537 RepID=A0AAE1NFN3_9EUCA|nr:hypothetical protein Pmani_038451 [Petrolisthes manimaculis]
MMLTRLCGDVCSRGRGLYATLRPLLLLCTATGAFPYTSVTTTTTITTTNKESSARNPGGRDEERYRQVVISFPSFLAAVWLALCPLFFMQEADDVKQPFSGEEEMSFLKLINDVTGMLFITMLLRRRRVQGCLDTLMDLDSIIPTRGTKLYLPLVAAFIAIFHSPIRRMVDMVIMVPYDGKFVATTIMVEVISLYFMTTINIYMFVVWMAAAHLTEKFAWVNQRVKEAVKARDHKLLQECRHQHAKLRCAVRELDDVMWPSVTASYFNHLLMTCLLFMDSYINISGRPLWFTIFGMFSVPLAYFLDHFFCSQCASEAMGTLLLLDCQDIEDDQFSRQVPGFRREVSESHVGFTVGGFIDLNMQEYWRETQFMVTLVVVLIQFSENSVKPD